MIIGITGTEESPTLPLDRSVSVFAIAMFMLQIWKDSWPQ
jgi:hypothetical protein